MPRARARRRPVAAGLLSLPLALLGAAAWAPPAAAHSLVRPAPGLVNYLSADATSLNTVTVTLAGGRLTFRDPTVDGGMDPGSCLPGDVSGEGYITSTDCPAAGVRRVRLDLGEREDAADVRAAVPATLLGGPGADRLRGGPAADQVDGGTGDDTVAGGGGADVVSGGEGADTLAGEAGDDRLSSRDGLPDTVSCGEGDDQVDADTLDEVAGDCETVTRVATVPPPGSAAGAGDRVAPQLRAVAARTQRIGTSRRLRLVAVTTEAGALAASGVLDVDGLALPVETRRRDVAIPGGGVELTFTLSSSEHRQALRALRRGRRVRLALTVVATDRAGNSRDLELPSVRLRR
jgi:Ca2+-binding RTX toxin-like protein